MAKILTLLTILLLNLSHSLSFSPENPTNRRILVLLDDFAIKSSHSLFFDSLLSRNYQLDFKLADDPKLALQRYGQFLYDGLIIFAPYIDRFGGSINQAAVLEFVDSGRDLIVAVDVNSSDLIREIATECGVEFDDDPAAMVIDHTSYALSEFEGDHTLIASNEFIGSDVILGSKKIEAAVLFQGTGHSVNPSNSHVVQVLSASPSAYLANPLSKLSSAPTFTGPRISLVSVVQARNNARILISGSLKLFSDRFLRSGLQKAGSSTRFDKSGNEQFVTELSKWIFHERGHLKAVNGEHHRRSVAASLVAGVYILERDRQENRDAKHALASPWWEFFNFRLIRQLVDDVDQSIFGAIYEYELKTSSSDKAKEVIPHYVIAFRGTLTSRDSVTRDIELDLHILRQGLHKATRSRIAVQAVRDTVASSQHRNVWLAGHSLGAAMAILAGKEMAVMGTFLTTFLFNPPFISAPIEQIKHEGVKHGIRVAGSVITAGLAFAMAVKQPQQKNRSVETFSSLATWVPNLYVHPADHICSEYIGYFQHREKMEKLGVGQIEKMATQHSLGGLLMTAFGKEADPVHLLPSACLTINLAAAPDLKKAHALQQWWQPESQVNFKTCAYLYS